MDRREFTRRALIAAAAGLSSPFELNAAPRAKLKAIAFDAFALLDPRPIFSLAESLYPGKGMELSNAWRTRQFVYQWLRAMSGTYADFWQVTEDALIFSGKLVGLELSRANRSQLMEGYLQMNVWPDVPQALEVLRRAEIRLAFLSNATLNILQSAIRNANLEGSFEHVISTDQIRNYKPAPRAYQLAIDAFGLKKEEIGFVAFAGWDAADD